MNFITECIIYYYYLRAELLEFSNSNLGNVSMQHMITQKMSHGILIRGLISLIIINIIEYVNNIVPCLCIQNKQKRGKTRLPI